MKSIIELTPEFCKHYENCDSQERKQITKVISNLYLYGCITSAFITEFDRMTDCALEPKTN